MNTAIAHDDLVDGLEEIASHPGATDNERYLSELLRDILAAAGDHPGVIDIINRRHLAAIEKEEQQDGPSK